MAVTVGAVEAQDTSATSGVEIVEVYPDTYEPQDAGEYVAVEFVEPTDTTGWVLEDDSRKTDFPNRTVSGTVYFSEEGTPEGRHDYDLNLRLSNEGEALTVRDGSGTAVDEVRYGDEGGVEPDEGEVLVRDGDGAMSLETFPFGGTNLEPLYTNVSGGTAFVVPDSGGVVKDEFVSAEKTVIVSAFSFGSQYLGDTLRETAKDADVSVLVETTPPGGFERKTERVLDSITQRVDVYVADGDERRYRYLHAKYAVIDGERSVVTTENFEDRNFAPDASGSRGWGVVVEDREVANYLTKVFNNDTDWRGVSPWEKAEVESHEGGEAERTVGTDFGTKDFDDATVEVFVTPDSAVEPVVSLIESADEEILLQQSYIRPWGEDGNLTTNPYVRALEERAEAGVNVEVLLDGRWFYEDENAEVAKALNGSDTDIKAQLTERPVHTKGAVVDGERVLISSINWNENSPTNNREVGVVVHNEAVGEYFAQVFENDREYEGDDRSDRDGSGEDAPTEYILEIVIIVFVSGVGVWLVAREI